MNNRNEKWIFGLRNITLPKKFININKRFVKHVEILFTYHFPAEYDDYENYPEGLFLGERGGKLKARIHLCSLQALVPVADDWYSLGHEGHCRDTYGRLTHYEVR